ncbi:endonuclease/exonuclease/phosphatase family protein [Rubritalea tangerina]|uniref:Endonuclease/exonuclease/phosphatase family protein n=2 Tax=Rubritalea tangerina TaxID=430798 RepID=A0ABW4ZCI2_9BACT
MTTCLGAIALQASAQTLSINSTQFTSPDDIEVSWSSGPGNGKDWIGLYPAGVTPGAQASTDWLYIGGTQTSKKKGPKNGSVNFTGIALADGNYNAYYLSDDSFNVLAGPVSFSVQSSPGGGSASISLSGESYDFDETIDVQFSNGPGNATDWVGLYYAGDVPVQGSPALLWKYTNGTQSGGGSATNGTVSFSTPGLQVGDYHAYFFENNGYNVLDGPVSFSVVGTAGPAVPEWVLSNFEKVHGVVGAAYSGKVGAYASDPDLGDTLSFAIVSGPSWLSLAADGGLSGTPAASDIGTNTFTVSATDLGGNSATATMEIEVFASGQEVVDEIKVLSFNLWHGLGKINYGHRKGIEAVLLSGADIIGTQETVDNVSGSGVYQAQQIAEELGWYYSPAGAGDSGIVSRYPIESEFTSGIANGVKLNLTQDKSKQVILYNCHLDYVYYGPYEAHASGSTAQKVLNEEKRSQRDEEIAVIINGMTSDLNNANNIPVILTGDFNAPSHLDWTEATKSWHGGVGYVAWPTSLACTDAGLIDSFRAMNPNPAQVRGDTWSPLHGGTEPQDRIDFIYYKGGGLTPTASSTFMTAVEVTVGAWGSDITPALNNTWPSDHAAVLTSFSVN